MPRDAFGNEINEDPLAGIGSYGSAPSPSAPPPGIPGGPKRRGVGTLVAFIAVVLVLGVGLGGLLYLSGGEDDDSKTTTTSAQTIATEPAAAPDPEPAPAPEPEEPTPAAAAPAEPAKPPTGLQRGSLLRRANFIVALRQLKTKAGGKPRNLRVEATRIDIQLILNDGRMRNAQATWDGNVQIFSTTSTPIAGLKGFAWSRIDRSAPQRMVRSTTGRARKPASAFNYAVLLDPNTIGWSAFLKTGQAFNADASGHVRRQIS